MKKDDGGKKLLLRYAGFAMQLVVSLGLGVLGGQWIDKRMEVSVPVFVWLLPLLILIIVFWQVLKDTSKK